jgi:hypothetical protein
MIDISLVKSLIHFCFVDNDCIHVMLGWKTIALIEKDEQGWWVSFEDEKNPNHTFPLTTKEDAFNWMIKYLTA